MKKANNNLIFPNKYDYPQNLELLGSKKSSNIYYQLIESSASAYFETNFLTRYFFKKRFQLALQLVIQKKSKMEILDAGCGIGFFLPILSTIAKHIWAIDYAEHSLYYTKFMYKKRKLNNISIKQVNIMKTLPFPEKKFDLIICLSVLEHIQDLEKVTINFKRVLKKDGILIAGYPNEDNIIFRLFQYMEKKLLRPKVYKTFQGTKLIHISRAHQIDRALKKHFKIDITQKINLFPGINFYLLQKCSLK